MQRPKHHKPYYSKEGKKHFYQQGSETWDDWMETDLFGRNNKFIPRKCQRALVGGVAGIVIVFEKGYEKVIVLASLCFLYRQNLGGKMDGLQY